MGFCGCSLHASTISAGIYGIIFSIYGISWTSAAISAFKQNIFINSLRSSFSVFSFDNVFLLQFDKAIKGLVIFSLVLHILWLITSILLLIGNEKKNKSLLHLWIPVSSLILIDDVASAIYCLQKPNSVCGFIFELNNKNPNAIFCNTYFLLACLFMKFGIITIAIQIALTIYVSSRAKEIDQELHGPQLQVSVFPPSVQTLPSGNVSMQPYPYVVSSLQPNVQMSAVPQNWNGPAPPYTKQAVNNAYS